MKANKGQMGPKLQKCMTTFMQTTELDCEKLSIHFDLPFHCNVVHYCNDKKANSLGFLKFKLHIDIFKERNLSHLKYLLAFSLKLSYPLKGIWLFFFTFSMNYACVLGKRLKVTRYSSQV